MDPGEALDRGTVEADALLNADSSSAGATATDLKKPSTSVNHSRTKRISRSSTVRSTNVCLSMARSLLPQDVAAVTTSRRAAHRSFKDASHGCHRTLADGDDVTRTPTPQVGVLNRPRAPPGRYPASSRTDDEDRT